jgi:hypothetical protein
MKDKTKGKAKTGKINVEDKIDKDTEAITDEKLNSVEEIEEVIDDTGKEKPQSDKAEDENRDQ